MTPEARNVFSPLSNYIMQTSAFRFFTFSADRRSVLCCSRPRRTTDNKSRSTGVSIVGSAAHNGQSNFPCPGRIDNSAPRQQTKERTRQLSCSLSKSDPRPLPLYRVHLEWFLLHLTTRIRTTLAFCVTCALSFCLRSGQLTCMWGLPFRHSEKPIYLSVHVQVLKRAVRVGR